MQERLSTTEAATCRKIAAKLGSAFDFDATDEGKEYWQSVVENLCRKWKHGTSDGKPYIEPESPIPEGWRKALDSEHCRKDVKLWDKDKKQWSKRLFPSQPFLNGDRYIVPIDPPLTDEDACVWPRLLVMVRDKDSEPWKGPFRYFGKDDDKACPFVAVSAKGRSQIWQQARRATPEEIEAAHGNS